MNRFQPLVTYEYISQNRALKRLQFDVFTFTDQLHNQNKTGNARTVTLRRFRETTVAVEKKQVSHIQSVCL